MSRRLDESCMFCKIVAKRSTASIVHEDCQVLAFLDNRPAGEGHTLVIPKQHVETIYDTSDEDLSHLFKIAKKVAIAIRKALNPEGLTVIQRNGRVAGQHIMHLHVHVIPVRSGGRLLKMEEIPEASKENLDKIAKAIREHI